MADHAALNQLLTSTESFTSAVHTDSLSVYNLLASTLTSTDTELSELRAEVNDLRHRNLTWNNEQQTLIERLNITEDRLERSQNDLQDIRCKMEERVKEIARLEVQLEITNKPSYLIANTGSTKSAKLPDPPIFTGNSNEVHSWAEQTKNKLEGNIDHYPTPYLLLAK